MASWFFFFRGFEVAVLCNAHDAFVFRSNFCFLLSPFSFFPLSLFFVVWTKSTGDAGAAEGGWKGESTRWDAPISFDVSCALRFGAFHPSSDRSSEWPRRPSRASRLHRQRAVVVLHLLVVGCRGGGGGGGGCRAWAAEQHMPCRSIGNGNGNGESTTRTTVYRRAFARLDAGGEEEEEEEQLHLQLRARGPHWEHTKCGGTTACCHHSLLLLRFVCVCVLRAGRWKNSGAQQLTDCYGREESCLRWERVLLLKVWSSTD